MTYLTLGFTVVLGVDLLLSRTSSTETILSRNKELIRSGGQYEPRGYKLSNESRIIITERHKYMVINGHTLACQPGDPVNIEATIILNMVTHATIADRDGNLYDLDPGLGILDVFWFVPVTTFLTPLVRAILSRKNIMVIDFGVANLVLL